MAGSPQNTNMDLEYFKPIEPLGSPGGSAKPVKLAAGAAALAAAAAALFFFYVVTTALHIGTTTARVEIRLVNRQDHQAIYWQLVQGPPPELPPPGIPTLLEEDQEVLLLEDLTPCTEYTILFLEYDQQGDPVIVHTFTFVTDCGGAPQIPDSQEPPAEPPVTPPEDPPVTPPETPPVTPPEDPPVTPPVNPPVDPPVTPPNVPGGGGGQNPPQRPGSFGPEGREHLNTISYNLDYSLALPDQIPVTVTFPTYEPGSYDFEAEVSSIFGDDADVPLEEGVDYRDLQITLGQDGITVTFDLIRDDAWTQKGYTLLRVELEGANYKNGSQVGESVFTYAAGQVNMKQGYDITLSGIPDLQGFGLVCDDMQLYAGNYEGVSLTGVVPGQEVELALYFSGSATDTVTFRADYQTTLPDFQARMGTYEISEIGDDFAYLVYSFTMPEKNVTDADLAFTSLVDVAAGASDDEVQPVAPSPSPPQLSAPEADILAGANPVGPLYISQGIHGLDRVHTLFHTDSQPNGAQLSQVEAGETVYLEIFLQGAAGSSFHLGASFAPSAAITDLRVLNEDDVQIGVSTDAYLRFAFTMPAGPVTAADIGFIAFTANQ